MANLSMCTSTCGIKAVTVCPSIARALEIALLLPDCLQTTRDASHRLLTLDNQRPGMKLVTSLCSSKGYALQLRAA
jgi:hypothetical protein